MDSLDYCSGDDDDDWDYDDCPSLVGESSADDSDSDSEVDLTVDVEGPRSSTDTSDMNTSYLSLASDTERIYRGKPTRTVLLQAERKRVPTRKRRKEVPNIPHKRQACDGEVKAFTPALLTKCCLRQCAKYFGDPKDPQLVLARSPLYDACLSRPAMRDALHRNAICFLTNPCDGKPVCNKMACIAYSCSISFLNPDTTRTKGTQGDSNRRRAKQLFSVMAWFKNEKELADIMPDTGVSLFPYHRKYAVYHRYQHDCDEITRCSTCPLAKSGVRGPCGCEHAERVYIKVSESYFFQIWQKHFTNCRIRKHMRFSKCTFCVKWRGVRNNRKNPKDVRLGAKARLAGHYSWIARERAEEIHKVHTAPCWLPCVHAPSVALTPLHSTPLTLAQPSHPGSIGLHHHRDGRL